MSVSTITPVVLAGGKGARLWPVSRTQMPKQFCKFKSKPSLFQQTIERLSASGSFSEPLILTSETYLSLVQQQMREIGVSAKQIICEPCSRDTAPAIALAALSGKETGTEMMMVFPSDHMVLDVDEIVGAAQHAASIASDLNMIVTFGIKPTGPAIEYGYLEAGDEIADGIGKSLVRFVEKPDLKTAENFVARQNMYWNAGMFMFSPVVMCRELEIFTPELYSKVKKSIYACQLDQAMVMPDRISFSEIEPISIDYAVMEKTSCAALVPVDPKWTDVGSWNAVWETSAHDKNGNVLIGDAMCVETSDSFISTDGPLIGVAGVSDIVVVANRDAVLVTSRKNCQSVKPLIKDIELKFPDLTDSHVGEERPWGSFTSLHKGENHQVKTITVEPGGQLSLQYHYHRAEHWVVVSGTATVTINSDVMQLTPCQQVYIPQGAVHRLENLTDDPVQIIEVQYGSYLGEDDIVRVEDVYGRSKTENPGSQKSVA